MEEWEIDKPLGQCYGTGRQIEAGEEYYGALVESEEIRHNHVAHVGEVARRFEVADVHDGILEAPLDIGNLLGEIGHHEDGVTPRPGVSKVAAMNMVVTKGRFYFLADVAVNITPTAEDLADIAVLCARGVRRFDVEPRMAMISFSNFGSLRHPESDRVRKAVELVREREPNLMVDGEMQADTAVSRDIVEQHFPFSQLKEPANVLIFPCLNSSTAADRLLQSLGGAESIGPILLGMNKPAHVLQFGGSNEADVINMTAIAVVEAQEGATGE